MRKLIQLSIVFVLFVSCTPKTAVEERFCPDGRKVFIYRNPEAAFPVFAKEYTASLKATVDVIDVVKAEAEPQFKDKLVMLRDKLNQDSAQIEMFCKQNMMALQIDACNPESVKRYYEIQNVLQERATELMNLRNNLEYSYENKKPGNRVVISEDKALKAILEFEQTYTEIKSSNY